MIKFGFNKSIFKNRTVLGLIYIVLSLVVCFGITPLFNNAIKAQSDIVRVKSDISKGTLITSSMVETVTVGSYNLPTGVLKNKDQVIGKYATADLQSGDYILSGKLSEKALTDSPYLTKLNGTKAAISVTIPSFAAGLSGKLEAGDIVSILASDTDTKTTTMPGELRYVEVLAATASTGADKEYTQNNKNSSDSEENSEKSLPSTLTLLVNMKQAQTLANLEVGSKIHAILVYRGTSENADQFLAKQDEYFKGTEAKTQSDESAANSEKTQQEDGKNNGN